MESGGIFTVIVSGVMFFMWILINSQRKAKTAELGPKIREILGTSKGMTLPEILKHMGLEDTRMNRGMLKSDVLFPLVYKGEILREERTPFGSQSHLDVDLFRLPAAGAPTDTSGGS